MATGLSMLERAIVAVIVALGTTAYQQGDVEDVWAESPIPLDPLYDPDSIAHLGFTVQTRSSQVTATKRLTEGFVARCTSAVDVVFTYRLRPTEQVLDYRLAQDAARDILRSINAMTNGTLDDVIVRPRQRFQARYDLEGVWLLVTVGFDVDHDEEI